MTSDERMFFNTTPGALPLYEVLRNKLLTECPDTTLQVQKSQITFIEETLSTSDAQVTNSFYSLK